MSEIKYRRIWFRWVHQIHDPIEGMKRLPKPGKGNHWVKVTGGDLYYYYLYEKRLDKSIPHPERTAR